MRFQDLRLTLQHWSKISYNYTTHPTNLTQQYLSLRKESKTSGIITKPPKTEEVITEGTTLKENKRLM